MKINGRDVNGRKHSFNSSINSSINPSINSLKSTSSRKARNSSIDSIFQANNLNRDIIRDFSHSKGKQNAQFEQAFSKIILIMIFGPMLLNLIVSIISTIFYSLKSL